MARPIIVVVVWAFAVMPAFAQVLTRPTPTGAVIQYRDPAYDNAWREFFVPQAPVNADLTSTVSGTNGTWRYEFVIRSESNARVRHWQMQLSPNTELTVAMGWRCARSAPANSVVTCETLESGQQTDLSHWVATSPDLPDIRLVSLRSTPTIETAVLDMPDEVKQRVGQMERAGAGETHVIGPWIATYREIDGVRQAIPLTIILSQLEVTLFPAAKLESRDLERAALVLGQVNAALKQGRRSDAKQLLTRLRLSTKDDSESSLGTAIRSALAVIVDYASQHLDSEP